MVTYTVSKDRSIQKSVIDQIYSMSTDDELISSGVTNTIIPQILKGDKYSSEDTPQQRYKSLNKGKLDIGWFIPDGMYESVEDFEHRSKMIYTLTEGMEPKQLFPVIEKYFVPLTGERNFHGWLSHYVYPWVRDYRNKEELSRMIVGRMIDFGWDPMKTWRCSSPDASKTLVQNVIAYTHEKWIDMSWSDIQSEVMLLFKASPFQIKRFLHDLYWKISRAYSKHDKEKIEKELVIQHVEWLIRYDSRVYEYFYTQYIRKKNHKRAMKMKINDPSASFDDRIRRDQMLITSPSHNEDEFENKGHNKLRKNIMKEKIKPYDYQEKRREIFYECLKGNRFIHRRDSPTQSIERSRNGRKRKYKKRC